VPDAIGSGMKAIAIYSARAEYLISDLRSATVSTSFAYVFHPKIVQ